MLMIMTAEVDEIIHCTIWYMVGLTYLLILRRHILKMKLFYMQICFILLWNWRSKYIFYIYFFRWYDGNEWIKRGEGWWERKWELYRKVHSRHRHYWQNNELLVFCKTLIWICKCWCCHCWSFLTERYNRYTTSLSQWIIIYTKRHWANTNNNKKYEEQKKYFIQLHPLDPKQT